MQNQARKSNVFSFSTTLNPPYPLAVWNFCRNKGIVLLSFPPHCACRMQPLDCSVYDPQKRMMNSFSDSWIRTHREQAISIYDIPSTVKEAIPLAVTQKNITSGFECTEIFPLNRDIFKDLNFLPSGVTERSTAESSETMVEKSHPKDKYCFQTISRCPNVIKQPLKLRLRTCQYQSTRRKEEKEIHHFKLTIPKYWPQKRNLEKGSNINKQGRRSRKPAELE